MKGVIKLSKADISSITDSEERFEIIDGVKIYMLAAASFNHNFFAARLVSIFNSYFLKHGKGVAVHDVDVPLPDGNLFRPDVCVITDFAWLESDENSSVVPALVVEILSRSTMKNDLGRKKNIYERISASKKIFTSATASRNIGSSINGRSASTFIILSTGVMSSTMCIDCFPTENSRR